MICDRCGVAAPALKTVRWRSLGSASGRPFALCDACHAPLVSVVWIVPGSVPCFGTCRGCGAWASVRALSSVTGGGLRGAPSGICPECTDEPEGGTP